MPNIPLDKKLYATVTAEAKKKFMVWPSAYASGWVVKTYKARGGKYETVSNNERPLKRWYDENWVDVCGYVKDGKLRPCGRKTASWKDYPYCRPEKRVSAGTPTTLMELVDKLGMEKIREMCAEKKSRPKKRMSRV